jgi:glycosyltransferase involved in cell wall biosynthesis
VSDRAVLDVLVPTYGRPVGAIGAIESVLAANDPRVNVICHSNGIQKELEKYRNLGPAVTYRNFEVNRGPEANFLWLLQNSSSKFCMLLSDEDYLVSEEIPRFVKFLEDLDDTCNLVSCSVFDEETERFDYQIGDGLEDSASSGFDTVYFNLAGFTNLAQPNYMSGYVYRTDAISLLDLKELTGASQPHSRNVYSPVDIAQQVLKEAACRFYSPKLVCKGPPIKSGGHAFAHRSSPNQVVENNLDLNPEVYGPYARVCQYLYREQLLCSLRPHFKALSFLNAEALLYTFFFIALRRSPDVTVIPEGTNIQKEAVRAVTDSLSDGVFSNSITANLFIEAILGSSELVSESMRLMQRTRSNEQLIKVMDQYLYLGS